ncbi:MAG: DUF3604 domain-containing protein [Pseudomonadota bacterium]
MQKRISPHLLLCAAWLCLSSTSALAATCPNATTGEKQLLWGDLHVHTAHSLDAWAFGALATPKEAFAFAKGQPLRLANGEHKVIDRPLDFAAVTDHAETYDQMYLCTDPVYADDPYCNDMRDAHAKRQSRQIFNNNLLPVVGSLTPKPARVCENKAYDCPKARMNQWRRAQFVANDANEPCQFTALIGYEWTASPGGLHWHRNVIFGSDVVPNEAYDFIRYPRVQQLWQKLSENCKAEEGCQVLTIPHNINWADGGSTFAVEDEDENELAIRARYERLAEIYQEKGASECLPEREAELDEDCDFELVPENAARARLSGKDTSLPEIAWARARSSYYRTLLARGLRLYQAGASRMNPLMLGAIGSTDSHFGTPGRVAEADYTRGISTLFRTDEEQLNSTNFNPGGLVAVWAEENTRAAVFNALHRREAYATSGPRIMLRFGVGAQNYCVSSASTLSVTMGGTLETNSQSAPWFVIEAAKDQTKLAKVQIIKGEYRDDKLQESAIDVAEYAQGQNAICLTWQDPAFDPTVAAYWYTRVSERPTPRWSKHLCEQAKLCEQFPEADKLIAERAWSSPVWSLPTM